MPPGSFTLRQFYTQFFNVWSLYVKSYTFKFCYIQSLLLHLHHPKNYYLFWESVSFSVADVRRWPTTTTTTTMTMTMTTTMTTSVRTWRSLACLCWRLLRFAPWHCCTASRFARMGCRVVILIISGFVLIWPLGQLFR